MYCFGTSGELVHQGPAGIVIKKPKIIDLFSYKFYGGPHEGGFGIANYNPRSTYCPLVPKQYSFSAIEGSPQIWSAKINDVIPIKNQ